MPSPATGRDPAERHAAHATRAAQAGSSCAVRGTASSALRRRAAFGLVAAIVAALLAPVAGAIPSTPLASLVGPADALVIGGYVPTGTAPVAPGVTHEWGSLTTTYGNQDVQVVTVDPTRPEIGFEAALSNDSAAGTERTTAMALRRSAEGHRVVAAINGDVWGGSSSLLANAPNGIHIENGELMVADATGPRVTFGFGPDRVARVASVRESIVMTLADGGVFPVGHVNQSPNGAIALFTPRFGAALSTALAGTEVVVAGITAPLTPTGSWSGTIADVRAAGSGAPIDPGTFVIVVPSSSLAALGMSPGLPISLTATITPGWEGVTQAVSGRGYVVRGGVEYVSPGQTNGSATHPRTSIGVTADGKVVMVTVDGRRPDSSLGVDLDELAQLMIQRGAVDAINLDGGSSSTMDVRLPGQTDVSVVNHPSAGYEIAVTNGIEVVLNVPTGPLALLTVSPGSATLYPQQSVAFSVIAQDAAYNPVAVAPDQLAWSSQPELGTFDASGTFTATTPGTGVAVVSSGGVTGSVPLNVLADTSPPVASPPQAALPAERAIGSTLPVALTWVAATDVGSGVAGYELEQATDGGPWAPVTLASPSALSVTRSLTRNHVYRFRVRATDRAGNAGEWRPGIPFRLAVAQETTRALVVVKGTWLRAYSTSYDGSYARTTRSTGALARFTFTGIGFAWVAAKSPVRGMARVSVDGGPAVSVNLYQTTSAARLMVLTRSWASKGTHTVTISVVGTSGHPRVDLDAFVVLAPA